MLAACTAVSVLSTDLITPSIPDLPDAFGTTAAAAQMTVSINLAAYALAQLVHGPVADAVGRRLLLMVAFGAFICFSVLCAMAPRIDWLLSGRFLQGLASSVPSVVVVLMIRELYASDRAVRVMAAYGAAMGLAPALGPLMGGYLHVWFGWQAGFWVSAGLAALVLLALWRLVPESLASRRPLNPRATVAAYATLLGRPAYLMPVLGVSLLFAALFAYVTTAPLIFIDLLGLAPQRYGLTSLVIVAAFMAANAAISSQGVALSSCRLLRMGAAAMLLGLVPLVGPVLLGHLSVLPILAGMAVYGAALAAVLSAGPLVVLGAAGEEMPQGPASALLGSMQLGLASLAGYASAHLYDGSALPMVLVIAACVLTGAAILLLTPTSRAAPVSAPAG